MKPCITTCPASVPTTVEDIRQQPGLIQRPLPQHGLTTVQRQISLIKIGNTSMTRKVERAAAVAIIARLTKPAIVMAIAHPIWWRNNVVDENRHVNVEERRVQINHMRHNRRP